MVRGIWRLRVSEEERRVRQGVKVKDSHKDKVEQCSRYFIAGSVYLVLNSFLGWEPLERVNGRKMSFAEQKALGE